MDPDGSVLNVSGMLFLLDEKLMKECCDDDISEQLENSKMVSNWSSIQTPRNCQKPAYLNQSRISTWYQDNGSYPVLQYSNQFGLNVMGGAYDPRETAGSRPGVPEPLVARPGFALYNGNYTPVRQPDPILNTMKLRDDGGIVLPTMLDKLTPKFTYGM